MPELLRGALCLALLVAPSSVRATRIEVGPFLQDVRADGVTVVWETDAPAGGEVVVALPAPAGERRFPSPPGTHHVVRVAGLPPGRFPYRVVAGDAAATGELATAKEGDSFTFLVYGDNRDRDAEHARVVAAMVGEHADLAINTGDLTGDGGEEALWRRFFAIEQPLLSSLPMYPALGNHELLHDPGAAHYHRYFVLPGAVPAGAPRRWYSFRYGNALFIALDGNESRSQPQARWLHDQLERAAGDARVRHLFVYFHQPPFSVGGFCGSAAEQGLWVPEFERRGVRAVFTGHDHSYQRLERNGVRYFVTGGGGAPLHKEQVSCPAHDHHALRRFASLHHHMRVRVRGDQATLDAIAVDGMLIDSVELHSAVLAAATPAPAIAYHDAPLADLPLSASAPMSRRSLLLALAAAALLVAALLLLTLGRRRRR